jgi:hypothetical protein
MSAKKPPRTKFMLRMPPQLHRELLAYSGVKNEPLSDIIVEVLEAWWKDQPERKAIAKLIPKQDDEGQHAAAA